MRAISEKKGLAVRKLVWGNRGYKGGIGFIEGKENDGARGDICP